MTEQFSAEQFAEGIGALADQFDTWLDDGDYEQALETAQFMCRSSSTRPNVPAFMQAFAQHQVARTIGEAFEHSIQIGNREELQRWAKLLPEGHDAAKRAVELKPDLPGARASLETYEKAAADFSVFRTGQFTPDGLHEGYEELVKRGDSMRQSNEHLLAIEAYDAALAAMQREGYSNNDWEGIARYKIAQSIINGSRFAAECAAGDHGRAWKERESRENLMQRFHELARRGWSEMEAAVRLVPNDAAPRKGMMTYEQWKINMPWIFEERKPAGE